jgi:hypothetical protein
MQLVWIVGKVGHIELDEDGQVISGSGFIGHGIDTTGLRKSIQEGQDQLALVHSSMLTATQLNAIWGVPGFVAYDDTTSPTIMELMASEEWVGERDEP